MSDQPELRPDEVMILQCAGGKCVVCRERVPPGPAVQLSRYSNTIRHIGCMPKTDNRMTRVNHTRRQSVRHERNKRVYYKPGEER